MFTEEQGQVLLAIAKHAIADVLDIDEPSPAIPDWAKKMGASFVTLTVDGRLRGCIGALEAYRPLADDVAYNAKAAAFGDPRFPPLDVDEYPLIKIEVSVLSPHEEIKAANRVEAIAKLRPGVDGVVMSEGFRRGTFLPQVWEQLPDPEEFLDHLGAKAGLGMGYWSPKVKLSRYSVQAFTQ